ncbi:MAG: hypothetical protein ACPHCI_01565 [Solirubrobacterales bacterium]
MSDGKFRSRYTQAQLLDATCDVLRFVRANSRSVSQDAFNGARAEAGHPDLPLAKSVCDRAGMGWEALQLLAERSEAGRAIALGRRDNSELDADWVTTEQIVFALRLVSLLLDRRTFSTAEYRRERAAIVEDSKVRLLPSEEQVLSRTQTWQAALAIAGLDPELGVEHELDRFQEAFKVLDTALSAHEIVPTLNEVVKFARANGMRLPDVLKPFAGFLDLWRQSREQRGLTTPPYEPHRSNRPDFGHRVLDAPTQRVRRGYWTEARAVEAMRRFLDMRAPGEPTTRKAYVDWSNGDREAPAASHLDREFGGFARVRRLARYRS